MAAMDQPLSDAEYARITVMLDRSLSKGAMNLEMLDGFFAALICGPEVVPPSEYLREIWGGGPVGEFRDEAEMQEFFELAMRHWNNLARTFNSNEPFLPFLFEDEFGIARGNDWAQGFTRGMKLRRGDWAELFEDEDHAGLLLPILALAHEHDTDPDMRPYRGPMDAERRNNSDGHCCMRAPHLPLFSFAAPVTIRRGAAGKYASALGREGRTDDPCPCGSGKKFKKCCRGGGRSLISGDVPVDADWVNSGEGI